MGIDCALLRDVPPAEHHHSGDRGGLPLPRRRGLPLAGPPQGGPDPLLARAHASGWRLRRLVGDGSYAGEDVAGDGARRGAVLTVASRPRERAAFVPIPLRWRVEQALGILTTRNRRLVRDWEQL